MTNIIFIMSDQQRADSLGCTGNKVARTPALDALAARGAVMENHFTPNQICSPSRATLFSGLYPRHHGLTRNGVALSEDVPLLTHDLKRAGYRTFGVGKFHFQPILAPAGYAMPDSEAFWELEDCEDWRGPFYGFDEVDILIGESAAATKGGHYARWLAETAPGAGDLYLPEESPSPPPVDLDEVWKCALPEELHYNTWIADRACEFLEKEAGDTPFFLYVSFPDPHHPFSPPTPWCDLFDAAGMPASAVVTGELAAMPDYIAASGAVEAAEGKSYIDFLLEPGPPREQGFMQTTDHISPETLAQAIAHTHAMVSMIDACVGRILGTLDDVGRRDETLILFTSDHGELLGDHGVIRKGAPPYRQLLQVPMVVAGPSVAAGRRAQLTSHVDLRPTLLDLLGLPRAPGDGTSFAGVLADPAVPGRDELFAEYHPRLVADQYNLSFITPEWRLTVYPRRSDWGELFDRRGDPGEHKNLYFDPGSEAVRDQLALRLSQRWPPAPDVGGESIAVY